MGWKFSKTSLTSFQSWTHFHSVSAQIYNFSPVFWLIGFSHKNTDRFPDWASLCVDPQNVSGSWGLIWQGWCVAGWGATSWSGGCPDTVDELYYLTLHLSKSREDTKKGKTKIVSEQNRAPHGFSLRFMCV